MSKDINLPPNIEEFVSVVNKLENKGRLSSIEKKKLCLCKLKVAMWACKSEGLGLSRYSLSQILGPDTSEVFAKTEEYMAKIKWDSKEDQIINSQILKKYRNQPRSRKSGVAGIELFK